MTCDNCGKTWTGPGYDGEINHSACPGCGYALNPTPTKSDMGIWDMAPPAHSGMDDMGGNPLQEGVWAGIDGGWQNRMKRDESFASVRRADVAPPMAGGNMITPGPGGLHGDPRDALKEIEESKPGIMINGQPLHHALSQLPYGHAEPIEVSHPHPKVQQIAQQVVSDAHGGVWYAMIAKAKQKALQRQQMQGKTAMDFDDDDLWGDDIPNPTEYGVPQGAFILDQNGRVFKSSGQQQHHEIASQHNLQGFPQGYTLGYAEPGAQSLRLVQHESGLSPDNMSQIFQRHFPLHGPPENMAAQTNDQRWFGEDRSWVKGRPTNPMNHLLEQQQLGDDRRQQMDQAQKDRGRPFGYFDNPYINRGGNVKDNRNSLYHPWDQDSSSIASDLEMHQSNNIGFQDMMALYQAAEAQARQHYMSGNPEAGHPHAAEMHQIADQIQQNWGVDPRPNPEEEDFGRGDIGMNGYHAHRKQGFAFLAPLLAMGGRSLARGVAAGLVQRAIQPGAQQQQPQEDPAIGQGVPTNYWSSIHSQLAGHPSSDDNYTERASGDPEDVDSQEVNDGDHSEWQNDPSTGDAGGTDGFRPEVEQAIEEAMPALLQFYQSEESGENDPAIAKLLGILQEYDPELLSMPHHDINVDEHLPKISAGVPGIGAQPMMQQPLMPSGNTPVNPATQGSCPHCGALIPPGSGICGQCGGALQSPQAPMQGQMAPGTQPAPGQQLGVLGHTSALPMQMRDPNYFTDLHGRIAELQASGALTPEQQQALAVAIGLQGHNNDMAAGRERAQMFNQGKTAANQGPHSPEQFQAVIQYLQQTGKYTPEVAEDLIMHPENYGDILSEIAGRAQPPVPDPDQGAPMGPPPGMDPAAMGGGGGMPPGGGGGMPMQGSRQAGDAYENFLQQHGHPSEQSGMNVECPQCHGQMEFQSPPSNFDLGNAQFVGDQPSNHLNFPADGAGHFKCTNCGYELGGDGEQHDNLQQFNMKPRNWGENLPMHQGADNAAPPCPECDSHTTGVQADSGTCKCHNCGNIWAPDGAEKLDPALAKQADSQHPDHADVQGVPAADQFSDDDPEKDINPGIWQTTDGQPLKVGQQYEMYTAKYDIPDIVKLTAIKPDGIEYVLQGEYGLEHRTAVSKQEADMDGLQFMALPDEAQPAEPVADQLTDNLPNPSDSQPQNSPAFSSTSSVDWSTRLAGKKYTPMEQREFIDEQGTARNADKLNLKDTHYEEASLSSIDDYFLW